MRRQLSRWTRSGRLVQLRRGLYALARPYRRVVPIPSSSPTAAFVRFPGLPHELGFSPHANEALAVKVEVDTRPPEGAGLETTLVRRHATLHLHHHDRPSLLAGKIHALLSRRFVKGRDVYALLWYLSDPAWPPPNLTLLANALAQTGWEGPPLTPWNRRPVVLERLEAVEWSRVTADVRPFLEREEEIEPLTLESFRRLLAG